MNTTAHSEILTEPQIESFWVSLYFLSRDRSVLFAVSGTILALAITLAWVLRAPEGAVQRRLNPADAVRHELAAPAPDLARLAVNLPLVAQDSRTQELAGEIPSLLEKSAAPVAERVALQHYWASLATGTGEATAPLLLHAHQPTPLPRANELLAELHRQAGKANQAITYLHREIEVSGADSARSALVALLLKTKRVSELRPLSEDPAFAAHFTPLIRLQMAREQHLWREIVWELGAVEREAFRPLPLTLSLVAGLAWFAIALQAIQPVRVFGFRTIVPAFAVLAGLLSTWPARFLSIWLADLAGAAKTGGFLEDLVYAVGFAAPCEEVTKLLFTLPFLPFLLRRGSQLEMLVVCGCVGLGFAIENTMQAYQQAGPVAAFGRLLTANFFHFAATGLAGLALCKFLASPRQQFAALAGTLIAVSLAQGVYDALMAIPGLRVLSIASIISFMALSLVFFHVLRQSRDGVTDQLSISATLLCGMTVLTGTMMVCASTQLGFSLAMTTLAANAAGLILVVCIFFRQLGRKLSSVEFESQPAVP